MLRNVIFLICSSLLWGCGASFLHVNKPDAVPGFVVSQTGDTSSVALNLRGDYLDQLKINILSPGQASQSYHPAEIKAFAIQHGPALKWYQAIKVQDVGNDGKVKNYFLHRITEGPMEVYLFHYYLKTPKDVKYQKDFVLKRPGQVAMGAGWYRMKFKEKCIQYFADCPPVIEKIKAGKFSKNEDFLEMASLFNTWYGEEVLSKGTQ